MVLDERKVINTSTRLQNLILENRNKLSITGVVDVLSFDDQIVMVATELGMLTIKGGDLKINKLNIDNSELTVEGTVQSLVYSDKEYDKKGNTSSFIGKIFK